ncbi:MAG: CBS domain-containing protein [Acidimicrobiales bacterium]
MIRVANILTNKGHDVATISQERTVRDAVELLRERGVGALVVTGSTPPLVGILSERDVVRALARHGGEVLGLSVAELMSADVTTCDEDASVTDIMGLMTSRRIRHVPVVHEGHLSGLISIGDVVKARLDELEHERQSLLDYVSAR